jgi:hypothetical protein
MYSPPNVWLQATWQLRSTGLPPVLPPPARLPRAHIALWVLSNFICCLMRAYFSRTLSSSLRTLYAAADLYRVIQRWTSTKHVRCSPVQPSPFTPSPHPPVCHSLHPPLIGWHCNSYSDTISPARTRVMALLLCSELPATRCLHFLTAGHLYNKRQTSLAEHQTIARTCLRLLIIRTISEGRGFETRWGQ